MKRTLITVAFASAAMLTAGMGPSNGIADSGKGNPRLSQMRLARRAHRTSHGSAAARTACHAAAPPRANRSSASPVTRQIRQSDSTFAPSA